MFNNLKKRNNLTRIAGVAMLASVILVSSCTKDDASKPGSNDFAKQEITDKRVKQEMDRLVEELPKIGVYNKTMDKIIVFDLHNQNGEKSFNFADPSPGFDFASSNGGQWVYYPSGDEAGLYVISSPSSTIGTGGGTVVAGQSALDIEFAVCFSASDEALGLDLFDFSDGFTGVSSIVGIAGDFEALQEGEFDEDDEDLDLFDFFQGFATYIVYADEASGNYDVVDWFDSIDDSPEDLEELAFAYVVDFQNEGIYFSSDGELNVSGSSIGFNGQYFSITNIFSGLISGEDQDEPTYSEVPGYGTMSCAAGAE